MTIYPVNNIHKDFPYQNPPPVIVPEIILGPGETTITVNVPGKEPMRFPLDISRVKLLERNSAPSIIQMHPSVGDQEARDAYVAKYAFSDVNNDIYRIFAVFQAPPDVVQKISTGNVMEQFLLHECGASPRSYSFPLFIERQQRF